MPLSRLTSGNHLPEYRVNRIVCEYCKHERQEEGVKATTNDNRSHVFCTLCNVALCLSSKRNCFVEYHSNSN